MKHTGRSAVLTNAVYEMLEPELILPCQFFGWSANYKEPERRLAAAVLRDALICYQRCFGARDRGSRTLFLETEAWITATDKAWPYSFERLCEFLNLDPTVIRQKLRRWREGKFSSR